MRLKWFRNSNPLIRTIVLSGLIFLILFLYLPLSKYIRPAIVSFLSYPLKFCQDISSNANQFLKFQDLVKESRKLKAQADVLTAQLVRLEEVSLENQRLRKLLSLPQRESLRTVVALIIGKDSSNWSKIIIINKGTKNGVKKGMPVVQGSNLVGKVIDAAGNVSRVVLIIDFNSKVPAKILRTREEGLVFGGLNARRDICKMKYIQQAQIGDKVITSGLGQIYPKGLLIGEVVKVQEAKNRLYKIAEIRPACEFANPEEVAVITGQ